MRITQKKILILFVSVYLTCCILTFMNKSAGLESFPLHITVLAAVLAVSLPFCMGFKYLYKTAYKKAVGKEPVFVEKREKTFVRQTGLDIVRCIAVFFVPFIHFFGLSGYYSTPLNGEKMLYYTFLRNLAVCAVPLFLIITGYFKIEKKLTPSHYKAIIPVLMSHIFITSIRLYVDFKYHGIDITGVYAADKLLYFNYGWYVRLYIGMVLLMPFLNLCFNAIKKREHKEYFILTLLFLTSLGPAVFDIVPKSWLILYVFMYYFIGGYFREYKLKINKPLLTVILFLTVFISSLAQYKAADGGEFIWDYLAYKDNSGYSAFPVVITSVIIFMLFSDIKIKLKPVKHILKSFSVVSLEMYLFSQMFDGIIYTPITEAGMDFYFFAKKMYLLVPLVFLLSYIAAKGKQLVFFVIYIILQIPYALSLELKKHINIAPDKKKDGINDSSINNNTDNGSINAANKGNNTDNNTIKEESPSENAANKENHTPTLKTDCQSKSKPKALNKSSTPKASSNRRKKKKKRKR